RQLRTWAARFTPADIARLKEVPVETLTRAQLRVMREQRSRFSPVLDGLAFTEHPFLPQAPARSSHLPMMVGTTRTELSNQLGYEEGAFTPPRTSRPPSPPSAPRTPRPRRRNSISPSPRPGAMCATPR
ncbi:MAG TPA: hypothetical protein PKA17_12100, partial [Phenylobacterium sp.]|nr:hypothetical protein [Phenylobacterium sp.]